MRKNWIVLGVFLGGIVASLDVLRSVISHQGFMSYTGVLFSLFVAFSVYGGILAILGMVLHSLFLKNEQRGQIVFLWLMLVLAISNSFSPMLSIFPRLSITEKSAFIVVYCMFVGLTFLNVRFWYRRTIIFEKVSTTIWKNIVLIIIVGSSLASFGSLYMQKNRSKSLDGDPPVFLISVRHWSALDYMKMSQLKSRVSKCDQYKQAVTPHTLEIPAYAALLSGKHPLHIPLWNNQQKASRSLRTLDQIFSKERYSTAAFVTDTHAQSFGERFRIYDSPTDSSLSLIHHFTIFRMIPSVFSGSRSGDETWNRAMEFAYTNPDEAKFIWIQLDHNGDMQKLEELLSGGIAKIQSDFDDARIALVGTQGRGQGVSKESLHVPMIFCSPTTKGLQLEGLVRTMDVMNTLLARVPIKPPMDVDGTDLFSLRKNTTFSGFNTIVLSQKESAIPNTELAIYVATTGQK
ncbi:MAG: hypothetical protein CL916_02680, partial [Deltaproteobacteria bacterium]|nr:hypothetical protein [Deltaproteobacteria bacterium]